MTVRRIKINGTPNRMGLIFQVLKAIADYGINIVTMESDPYICCKIEWDDFLSEKDFSTFMKSKVPEIESISYIDLMEYERVEAELSTLLDNIDDSIIKLDPTGRITSYNKKSEIFIKKKNKMITHINELLLDVCPSFSNKKIDSCTIEFVFPIAGKEKAFLAKINPVQNEQNIVTSYFVIISEMANIRSLINTIMRPSMVTFDNIQGESLAMKNTINLAKSVAPSDASVMIRGESGTGKELFARAIHMASLRSKGPFVAVNCASIPEALLESEFFGYEKGSFTGANSSGKQGYFELASGGTLLLDEIGELATHLQAKILRAIQEHKIRRIGGKHEIDIDVRIISATHRNLEKMIEEKSFRDDLYYRLNIIPIYIPPLREREGDIEKMIYYFIQDICKKNGRTPMKIESKAMEKLLQFNWPGNVRELNNVIERAICIAENTITEKDIILDYRHQPRTITSIETTTEQYPIDLPQKIAAIEKKYILKAITDFGSYRQVANNLNLSHTTIINKLKNYNQNI
ncbi:MAG: sigma 54-interacting transcriptional regulator [Anaerovorax sp.]|nr:sigma 54-interacting transcriptional regulator [Anaerovorax sp.]